MDHCLFVDGDNRLWSTGFNRYGRLGHGDEFDQTKFNLVKSLKSKKIVEAKCGYFHSLAVTKEGYLYSWGYGAGGRLGQGYDEEKRSSANSFLPNRIE